MSKDKPSETSGTWNEKTEFGINTRLREVVTKARDASLKALEVQRKKLERLTYGS